MRLVAIDSQSGVHPEGLARVHFDKLLCFHEPCVSAGDCSELAALESFSCLYLTPPEKAERNIPARPLSLYIYRYRVRLSRLVANVLCALHAVLRSSDYIWYFRECETQFTIVYNFYIKMETTRGCFL